MGEMETRAEYDAVAEAARVAEENRRVKFDAEGGGVHDAS